MPGFATYRTDKTSRVYPIFVLITPELMLSIAFPRDSAVDTV